ncbi:MAG: hypothetical protein EOP49_43285, partial [Sphingobacteriales bacterium]
MKLNLTKSAAHRSTSGSHLHLPKVLFLPFIFLFSLASCKKKDAAVEAPTLKGKWTIESFVEKEYQNNLLVDTDTQPGDGATLDFQDNGNSVMTSSSGTSSVPYTMASNTVVIDGDSYEIQNLTAHSVALYN